MNNIRSLYYPQMSSYKEMTPHGQKAPFAMLSGTPNFYNSVIQTDKYGFRLSSNHGGYINLEQSFSVPSINILLGGSTVFGVGSSSNDSTISSILFNEYSLNSVNLGIRGCVAMQEYIHLIRFINRWKSIKSIILFSGINDIYVNLLHTDVSLYDRFFEERRFEYDTLSLFRKFLLKLYSVSGPRGLSFIKKLKGCKLHELPMLFSYKSKPVDINQQLNILNNMFDRMFALYGALSKQLNVVCYYFLQPYAPWTNKKLTEIEKKIFKSLDQHQKNNYWDKMQKILNDNHLHESIAQLLSSSAKKNGIQFYDTNTEFTSEESLFVDRVHFPIKELS